MNLRFASSERRAPGEGTILIVDDDARLRETLRANFEVVGYDVIDVHDAASALAVLEAQRPDAIVVDVLPASGNGPDTIRTIRRHPQGAGVPMIVLSARIHPDDAIRALDAGADDVVVKPFAPEEMLAHVRETMRRVADRGAVQRAAEPRRGPAAVSESEVR